MDFEVVWSRITLEDVEAIAGYISRDSTSYAAAVVRKILDSTHMLSKFPFAGRIMPEFGQEDIREIFVYNYRIVYRIRGETITVASIIHGKRLIIPTK